MGEIKGIKNIRFLEQRPVALTPLHQLAVGGSNVHLLEIVFEDDSVEAVPLKDAAYARIIKKLVAQHGVALSQHVVAQKEVHLGGPLPATRAEVVLDPKSPVTHGVVADALAKLDEQERKRGAIVLAAVEEDGDDGNA